MLTFAYQYITCYAHFITDYYRNIKIENKVLYKFQKKCTAAKAEISLSYLVFQCLKQNVEVFLNFISKSLF